MKSLLFSLIALMAISFINPFASAGNTFQDSLATTLSCGPSDLTEIEAFFDEVIKEEMEKIHVPGVSIVLVRDSVILFEKGYGYANVEEQIPVNPGKTVFYPGSVSKLFTATAIMQLAEQGKLQLDVDVNRYLEEFKIDNNYPQIVTIENLLSHTGGFEEKIIGMAAMSPSDLVPMQEYLSSGKQPRVLPPGKYLSYSNYGYTLLGYLVEIVSGMPFPEYIEENILSPLGMHHSSFNYREDVFSDLAVGYIYLKGAYEPLPPLYLNVGPAGSLLSTAMDMSKFMIAHLQNGAYSGTEILQAETAVLMHSQLFTQHPRLAGWCHGFYERFSNNERIIEHAGDIFGYATLFALIPERKIGLYVNYNGGEGMIFNFRERLLERFIDHYYPEKPGLAEVAAGDPDHGDISRYEGTYRMNRYARLSMEKIMGLMFDGSITVNEDQSLTFQPPGMLNYPSSTWYQVDPLLFRNAENGRYMAFYEDVEGKITHLNLHGMTPANFEKLPWYATGKFHMILIVIFLLVFLSVSPGWAIVKWIKRLRKKTADRSISEKRCRRFAVLVSSLNLVFLIGFTGSLAVLGQKLAIGVPVIIPILLVIPVISVICTLTLVYYVISYWLRGPSKLSGRIQYPLLLVVSLLFVWFLNFWNLLGFNY